MDWIDVLQWPAMAVTVTATWLVGSRHPGRRKAGFWVFLLSNVLWIVWGLYSSAYALVALQFALVALNYRGMEKARRTDADGGTPAPGRSGEAA